MKPSDPVSSVFRMTPVQQNALKNLGITTVRDLLFHFPTRYGDAARMTTIDSLLKGDTAVVYGKIEKLKTGKAFIKKIPMAEGTVNDDTGTVRCIWFNQPYIAKMIAEGALVRVEGKVSERNGNRSFLNPKIEAVASLPSAIGMSLFGEGSDDHHLYPVYPESRGISSNWFFHAIQKMLRLNLHESIQDPIPTEILKKYNLPSLATAIVWIHAPKKEDNALAARKRFSFEEIFFIQLEKQIAKREYEANHSYKIEKSYSDLKFLTDKFPFTLTAGQINAINGILDDFKKPRAMMRLLEGDVGSGKTAVAAAAAWATVSSRPPKQTFGALQVAYMAPTEILATQHFESFIKYFVGSGIQIALITSSGCRKFPSKVNPRSWTTISRAQLLKWVANGEIPVLVGTHSLIAESVKFKHLAFAVIDEQHRFGIRQRQKLIRKHPKVPHLLSMTATPIPRTLALTLYGDLDLTVLDEMPLGRKRPITEIVLPKDREATYEKIRLELKRGRQAYVICPRIDEPDPAKEGVLLARSVKAEGKMLQEKVFPEFKVGILHGKMKPAEKDAVMKEFNKGSIDVLCATSVVEVGVNVENATIIVIEGAERFGLSQLHQLRGRVIRGTHQPYCYIFSETASAKSVARLKSLVTARNGFELAEFDLQNRGAGELTGRIQWGVSDIAMEALKNLKMVEAARTEATRLALTDDWKEYPLLRARIEDTDKNKPIHFE